MPSASRPTLASSYRPAFLQSGATSGTSTGSSPKRNLWHNVVMNEKQTVRPTKKQKELLSFIESFIGEHGYSPSYREIMSGQGYTSVATVALHVNNLVKRGHLRKRDHSARSLEVVESKPAKV